MGKIIAVANQRWSWKTTTSINLSAGLHILARRFISGF